MHKFSVWICTFFSVIFISQTSFAKTVCVSGECVGIKIYTDGMIVTDTVAIKDKNGKEMNIAEKYGIKKGDIIKKVNGNEAVNVESITTALESSADITLTVLRNGTEKDITLTPAITPDGAKLGLWLRDSTAGLGTVTCYDKKTFAALGHGIFDIDTGNIMPVKYGIIQECKLNEIEKGSKGSPGALIGDISGKELGKITHNTNSGLFGNASVSHGKTIETSKASEVKCGKAVILSNVAGGDVKEYEAEIKRLYLPSSAGKDMIIKITDKELTNLTGGIVQGMSGSPILQNGKLVGAVTHVFVNDPTKGYGIFIENMLDGAY